MDTGEIIALVVIVLLLAIGSIIVGRRCCKTMLKEMADSQKPRRNFAHSIGSSLRRSFRNTFRRSGRGNTTTGSTQAADQSRRRRPPPGVVMVDGMAMERSEIHPYYLKKYSNNTTNNSATKGSSSTGNKSNQTNVAKPYTISQGSLPVSSDGIEVQMPEHKYREAYVGSKDDEGGFAVAAVESPKKRVLASASDENKSPEKSSASIPQSIFDIEGGAHNPLYHQRVLDEKMIESQQGVSPVPQSLQKPAPKSADHSKKARSARGTAKGAASQKGGGGNFYHDISVGYDQPGGSESQLAQDAKCGVMFYDIDNSRVSFPQEECNQMTTETYI